MRFLVTGTNGAYRIWDAGNLRYVGNGKGSELTFGTTGEANTIAHTLTQRIGA